jgi:hypothetical protein
MPRQIFPVLMGSVPPGGTKMYIRKTFDMNKRWDIFPFPSSTVDKEGNKHFVFSRNFLFAFEALAN